MLFWPVNSHIILIKEGNRFQIDIACHFIKENLLWLIGKFFFPYVDRSENIDFVKNMSHEKSWIVRIMTSQIYKSL